MKEIRKLIEDVIAEVQTFGDGAIFRFLKPNHARQLMRRRFHG
jgi:hypothetical protein